MQGCSWVKYPSQGPSPTHEMITTPLVFIARHAREMQVVIKAKQYDLHWRKSKVCMLHQQRQTCVGVDQGKTVICIIYLE